VLRHRPALLKGRATGEAGRRRESHRRVTYVLAGPLRWVDPTVPRALLRVDAASGAGRRLCGRTLAVDLDHAHITVLDADGEHRRVAADLAPGDMVTVRVRLPRHLGELPDVVSARGLIALG
jgi:hypothetical protein